MELIAEEALAVKPETFFDQLLNWSLGIAAIFQILCLICVGFAASGSRNKGGNTTVRPLNCRCRSRSMARLSASAGGASDETAPGSAASANSAATAAAAISRDQRRTGSNGSSQTGHGRHHRRRNR